MRWVTETELPGYAGRVMPWLEGDPVGNNVLCTSIALHLDGAMPPAAGPPLLAWLDGGGGRVGGVAVCIPPFQLTLPALPPEAVVSLVDRLLAHGVDVPGVSGPVATADLFARTWQARTGVWTEVLMRERLYRLGELSPPAGVPGVLRRADEPDLRLLVSWMMEFVEEAGLPRPPDPEGSTRRRMTHAGLHLWDVDGTPSCMVGNSPPAAAVARIGPVYTPPGHRRRGYGSAATAALSRQLLVADTHTCILYADQANSTSNSVYRRIGYRPVSEHVEWLFISGTG
jgi:predicted GNAT family acetyltransferase